MFLSVFDLHIAKYQFCFISCDNNRTWRLQKFAMVWEIARDVYNNLEYFWQDFLRTQWAQKPKCQIYMTWHCLPLALQHKLHEVKWAHGLAQPMMQSTGP